MRFSGVVKPIAVCCILLAAAYTVRIYISVVDKVYKKNVEKMEREGEMEVISDNGKGKKDKLTVAEENQKKSVFEVDSAPKLPELDTPIDVCGMKKRCDHVKEIPFQIVSGSANIIGPSICVGGKWLVSNALGNVDRGMNVVVIDGSTGAMKRRIVFDLYGTDSGTFKDFLDKLDDSEVLLATTYDDASSKLHDDARNTLAALGSKEAKRLAFRDNWIFVGGRNLQERSASFEKIIPSDKERNRFGNWPAAIMLEECLPKL